MKKEVIKKIKENLLEPLSDKQRVMKLEYLLSHNYTIGAVIIGIDFLLILALNFILGMPSMLPDVLFGKATVWELLSPYHLLPRLSGDFAVWNLFVLAVVGVVDAVLVYRIKVSWSEKHFNVGQKGTDRFTTAQEIQSQYTAIEPLETPYKGDPGILISRIGNTFYIDQMVVNNLMIGLTRSGKGELYARTSMEIYSRAENQPSLIINDPKLEHYKTFAPILEERGFIVHLLNVSNPLLSMGFNLVGLVIDYYQKKDYDTAEQVANSLAHSFYDVDKAAGDMAFFAASASDLFTAMVLAAVQDAFEADSLENENRYRKWKQLKEEEKQRHPFRYRHDNMKCVNLYSMLVNFGQMVSRPINRNGSKTLVDTYFESRPDNDRAKLKYLNTKVAPDKTKSGIFSEMLRHLEPFSLRNVGKMTAESTVSFEEIGFGEKPVAIFLATPSYDTSLHKIPAIFIRQMYYALGKYCDDHAGKCKRQVKVIYEEAGNMPPVDLMETMTTMGLGQNISFDFYLQNYEQMDMLYGKEKAETIRGNCANHFFLQTNSEDTAKSFSDKLGTKSRVDVQRAGGKLSFHKYYTESVGERPLLYPNELMQLEEGETVVVRRSKRRDNNGRHIKPRPIFNSRENGQDLWYFHTYAPPERYKHPNEVNLMDVCKESRKHIDLEEYTWDITKSFRMMGVQVQIKEPGGTKKTEKTTLADSGRYSVIDRMLTEELGANYATEYGITEDTTIAEYMSFIESQDIEDVKKEILTDCI